MVSDVANGQSMPAPMSATPLEYAVHSSAEFGSAFRAVGVLIIALGALSFATNLFYLFYYSRNTVILLRIEWIFVALGVALAAFQIVAGSFALGRIGKFHLMFIWAWCSIGCSAATCAFDLYAIYGRFHAGNPRVPAITWIFEMVFYFNVCAAQTVGAIVVIILYRVWKGSASVRG